jgi:hypothetical protein
VIKLYLILFTVDLNRVELTKFLDQNPVAINFWFYNLPSSVFVKSPWTAVQLQELIQSKFGKTPSMLIVELNSDTNYAGWITKDHHPHFNGYLPK